MAAKVNGIKVSDKVAEEAVKALISFVLTNCDTSSLVDALNAMEDAGFFADDVLATALENYSDW